MTAFPLACRVVTATSPAPLADHKELNTIAGRIRDRRHALGLSQSGLAESARVSPELVSRIERGRCLPSVPTLVVFAQVLRTTPNHLLGFAEPSEDRDLSAIVDAVYSLRPAQREEIRRIAEALARYRRTDPPGGTNESQEVPTLMRPRADSGVTPKGGRARSTRPPKTSGKQ